LASRSRGQAQGRRSLPRSSKGNKLWLEGKIQERYGLAKDRARKDIDDWLSTIN
jgi:uncharacterized protein YjbJ (UPF0337 family)